MNIPSPPKISKLTGRTPAKRGSVFVPSAEEKQLKIEKDAYSGKSSYISDLQLEELKKVVAKAVDKADKKKDGKLQAEKELKLLEDELDALRPKYDLLCSELVQKKEHMKVLKIAFEQAKHSVAQIKSDQTCIVRDALNNHSRRVRRNKKLAQTTVSNTADSNKSIKLVSINNVKLATPR